MNNFTPVFTESANHNVGYWHKYYESLGLVTIPLIGKSPLDPVSWKTISPEVQWLNAGRDFNGNIGIVMGKGLAVIDADDLETANAISHQLNSMGIPHIRVSTPRGVHFYLLVKGIPSEFNVSKLRKDMYRGELRARNCYVVAPCSQVNGISYRWEKGVPEDLKSLSVVDWKDLLWLIQETPTVRPIAELPIRLLYREMPRRAKALLQALSSRMKGESVDKYQSRSEAEAAVIAILILAGWSFEQILNAFEEWSPGKYHEIKGGSRQKYFVRTYHRVLSKIADHPTRHRLAKLWQAVFTNPYWRGANGYLRRDTYLGLIAIGWQFGSLTVGASERDLAEYASASQPGIHKALIALSKEGVIKKLSADRFTGHATQWQINPVENISSQVMTCDDFSPYLAYEISEIWAQPKLGRSAGTVYSLLGAEPISIRQLAQRTGKVRSTVHAALENKLATSGLAIKRADGWVRGTARLVDLAELYETKEAADKRRSYHKNRRKSFLAWRARAKN